MASYWDRLAQAYARLGEAGFWLKHRLRIAQDLEGRTLEVCCGGGQLVLALLERGVDAYGIDLAPRMVVQARAKLAGAGFAPERVAQADVTRLPFADGAFDAVLSTGALALFDRAGQRAALAELARVTRREVHLLESYEKRQGLYMGRVLAWLFDGMRPIPQEALAACGLACTEVWDIFGGAFSYVRCAGVGDRDGASDGTLLRSTRMKSSTD